SGRGIMQQIQSASDTGYQRATMLDRIYRRIGQLDDASLASLDELTASADAFALADDAPIQPVKRSSTGVGRRGFLLALLAGGVATATGGAALILQQEATTTQVIPTVGAAAPSLQGEPLLATAQPAAITRPTQAEIAAEGLRGELSNANTDRIALQTQNDTLRTQLNMAQAEYANLTGELEARNNDIAYLQQVITLYDQMEAAELDNIVQAGLGPVGAALLTLQTGRGFVQAGLEQAAALLATVEVQAPTIANGLIWLENQVNMLAGALQRLEDALSTIVEPVQPVAQQIGDFIGKILDLLPFGVGDNIKAGLEATAAILTHIPELVASINPQIITPLRQWTSPDDPEKGLVAEVVRPISENLISPAQTMINSSTALETTYDAALKGPAEVALNQRAALREQLHTLTGLS
ncbi:hypothetical protein ACFLYO_07515, partial [Chloroflexota bacterium]